MAATTYLAYTLGGSTLLVFALPERREESAAAPAPAPDPEKLIERLEGAATDIEPEAGSGATE